MYLLWTLSFRCVTLWQCDTLKWSILGEMFKKKRKKTTTPSRRLNKKNIKHSIIEVEQIIPKLRNNLLGVWDNWPEKKFYKQRQSLNLFSMAHSVLLLHCQLPCPNILAAVLVCLQIKRCSDNIWVKAFGWSNLQEMLSVMYRIRPIGMIIPMTNPNTLSLSLTLFLSFLSRASLSFLISSMFRLSMFRPGIVWLDKSASVLAFDNKTILKYKNISRYNFAE